MSGKKRFYIEKHHPYGVSRLIDSKHTVEFGFRAHLEFNFMAGTFEAFNGYVAELCDLLNKGWEATGNLHDISDDDLLSELRRRINAANEQELDDWITATYDLHDDACLTEPE